MLCRHLVLRNDVCVEVHLSATKHNLDEHFSGFCDTFFLTRNVGSTLYTNDSTSASTPAYKPSPHHDINLLSAPAHLSYFEKTNCGINDVAILLHNSKTVSFMDISLFQIH